MGESTPGKFEANTPVASLAVAAARFAIRRNNAEQRRKGALEEVFHPRSRIAAMRSKEGFSFINAERPGAFATALLDETAAGNVEAYRVSDLRPPAMRDEQMHKEIVVTGWISHEIDPLGDGNRVPGDFHGWFIAERRGDDGQQMLVQPHDVEYARHELVAEYAY